MKHYEGMFILHNRELGDSSGDSEEETATPAGPEEVVRQLLEKVGGQVSHASIWANRKLAYPIQGNQTGTYVLTYFSGEPTLHTELNREVKLSDRCLRHMTLTIGAIPEASDVPGPLTEPSARGPRRTEDGAVTGDQEREKKLWEMLDYKNVYTLRRLVSAQGKLFSRARSGLQAKNQRKLRRAVFRARNLALLPFVGRS